MRSLVVVLLMGAVLGGCSPQSATLAQQQECSQQAEKVFNNRSPFMADGITNYSSHFEPSSNICFVDVTEHTSNWRSEHVTDAFEGREYGLCVGGQKTEDTPGICYVAPKGRPEGVSARSFPEFHQLLEKHFGIGEGI